MAMTPRKMLDASGEQQSSRTPLLQDEQMNEDENRAARTQQNTHVIRRAFSLVVAPLVDETGSWRSLIAGLFTLFVTGSLIGISLPGNKDLPTPWYRSVSSAIGYTYFLCWSVSFYPQVIMNFRRRSTRGLSADFCGLNFLGFACYTTYNVCFYWSPGIQASYRQRHSADAQITVQSNDVAFAIHALILTSITCFQIVYYGGWRSLRPKRIIMCLEMAILAVCGLYAVLVLSMPGSKLFNWLDFLYLLSYIKILISFVKYIPQVILNYRRKSTVGWSIWNIILDFTGGILSILQLVLDCADLRDWTGITGNLAKFGLGFVSIIFDIIFVLQHYVFYPTREADAVAPSNAEKRDEESDQLV